MEPLRRSTGWSLRAAAAVAGPARRAPRDAGPALDGVGAVAAAEVVDESRDREDVERGERVDAAVARRVVVVPVDGEDRQRDGRVRVLEVDAPGREVRGLVAEDLERDGRVAQSVAPEESHRLVQRATARLVVVEQVPGVEEAVRAALLGQEEHLPRASATIFHRFRSKSLEHRRGRRTPRGTSSKAAKESPPRTGSRSR